MTEHTAAVPAMADEEAKRRQLRTMQARATGLLVVAAIVYVVATLSGDEAVWVGYVRAAAEAGMVGGIADWFAVTALFRHPFGIPIPHTAIVPMRKDRIGRSLGNFVQNNFLAAGVITQKLKSLSAGDRLADWVNQPENAREVARHAAVAIGGVIGVMRDEEVQEVIERNLEDRVRSAPATPMIAKVLTMVTAGGRHQEMLDAALRLIDRLLEENKDALRARIREETPWWVPTPVDDKIYRKIVAGVETTLHEISTQPEHPLRARYSEAFDEFISKLEHSPEMREKGESWKEELLQHPAVRGYAASLWGDMKGALLRYSEDPESQLRRQIEGAVVNFGGTLREDPELRAKIDGWLESAVLYVVEQYRHEVGDLIATTVQAWDAHETSRKIELQIGKDLQFIRINGTLVGALVGLLLHLFERSL
jgi:uncharacterized membrane-anchored protein YjiN (DUF445 family)